MTYQARVRDRLLKLYADVDAGKVKMTKKLARVLFMTLEHEAFHAEVRFFLHRRKERKKEEKKIEPAL